MESGAYTDEREGLSADEPEVFRVAGYEDFSCIAGDCITSCCKGWRVYIDERAALRFQTERGLMGIRLRLALWRGGRLMTLLPERLLEGLYADEDDASSDYINRNSGRCPFLNRHGLCSLQLKKGADFLPSICRRYPRLIRRTGDRVELTLDLTCVHAAFLFLQRVRSHGPLAASALEHISSRELTGDEREYLSIASDAETGDTDFLHDLLTVRKWWLPVIGRAQSPTELESVMAMLLTYAAGAQEVLATGGRLGDVALPDTESASGRRGMALFPFSIMTYHELMQTELWQPMLQRTSPVLYELIERYYNIFADMSEIDAARVLDDMIVRLYAVEPGLYEELQGLFIYSVSQAFMSAYEDYSLHTHVLKSVLEVNLILLFAALSSHTRGGLPEGMGGLPSVISIVLRRVRHNDAVRHQTLAVLQRRL